MKPMFLLLLLLALSRPSPLSAQTLLDQAESIFKNVKKDLLGSDSETEPMKPAESAKPIESPKAADPIPASAPAPAPVPVSNNRFQTPKTFGGWLFMEPAENQAFLFEVVEAVSIQGQTLGISNGVETGFYLGRNLFTLHGAYIYGGTGKEGGTTVDDVSFGEYEVSFDKINWGVRWYRSLFKDYLFPYLGYSQSYLKGDLEAKSSIRDDGETYSMVTDSVQAGKYSSKNLDLGMDLRIHFWKVLTVGARAGLQVPLSVTERSRYQGDWKDAAALQSLDRYKSYARQPNFELGIHFGLAI